ncbi:pyruvate dehydrogenase complex dihydrolipoamide acetyltransferase [Azospirillum sp. RWY-5-1]|uniref:Acetyltransferase component of pyruvate dehydrogenase complex n=2 Tax=Azospirillum oleiclasticum TaxID=2735135 RepID=A0ABX2T7E4_9PROT|nr:pyruvate dehydrogenase complex dihydrolipoamide acetyltransferase [Azospirillum oleiclasticum]NYZ12032.1 pyruvate dehydrogenase complex dihydrolipoamide acetyltransferase [Azospirillum oleiclasticum]NYZ19192.1 pyruvate dehydrogenase complex dihydrolipoamide acetyltransferase [Azospirillum oleiclasticum]
MPALSPTMTEGNLARWLKKEGDTVKAGDVLAEIETDKATMEVEAVDEGRIGKILVESGAQGVAVNTPIAILLEEGEDESALNAAPAAPAAASAPKAAEPEPAPAPAAASAPAPAPAMNGGGNADGRVFASPLAKRIAEQAGLDLRGIKGSGPQGRIVKADVEAAKAAPRSAAPAAAAPAKADAPAKPAAAPAAATPAPAAAKPAGVDAKDFSDKLGMAYTAIPNSGMRKTIARRLSEAKQTVPHFYLTVDCQLDQLLKIRADLNGRSDSYKLSVNDFVIRAVALALKKVPAANAAYTDEAILQYHHADVSVAVATPNGLITPIIKAAETKGLAQISSEMKDLAKRARDGKLKPEEFQGGTFSVSNLGMFGIREFAAIINPPQGCILAVGAGEQRPVVKDGALSIATVMSCTLSVDHRVVDGAVGAEFLAAFKALVEDPLSMLL